MSLLTLLCCADAPAQVPALLAAKFPDCRVAVADGLERLSTDGLAVAIATASWLDTGALRSFCDRVPQALIVVLDPAEPLVTQASTAAPGSIYRRLPYPGSDAELVFTVAAALEHYRQDQRLKLSQVALDDAHRQLDVLQKRMSALMVQLDWGMASNRDRAQTEQALRRSRSCLAEAQRIAQLGSWEFDLASQTISWSAELFRIYGLDPAQGAPSYEQWRQTVLPEDWPPLEAAIGQAIALGVPYEIEHRIVRPDGSVRYVLGRGEAVYNGQGQVVQLRGTGQDCTEAKLVELALRQSEAKTQAIFSAVPDLMVVVSAQGQYLDFAVNGFTGDLLPLMLLDPVGGHLTSLLPPAVAHQWQTAIDRTLATGNSQFFEQQLSFGDRTQYEVVRMVPYQTDQVLVLVRDVSDRQTARQEQLRAEQAQRESETRFRQLAESLPGVVYRYILHPDGSDEFPYVSPRCDELFGFSPAMLQADPGALWALIHPEDGPRLKAQVAEAAQQPDQIFHAEYRLVPPGGDLKWVRAEASQTARLANGDIVWTGFVRDITRRKGIELEMRRNRDLREAIFNESTDALFLVDGETDVILDCNQRAVVLFEADSGDRLRQRQGNRLQARPFSEAELTTARQTMTTDGFWSAEVEYLTLRGQRFWGSLAAKLIAVADTPMLLVRVTDITERKRTELALEQAEERYRRATQAARVGVWELNLATSTGHLDPTITSMVGYRPEAMNDSLDQWFTLIHPEDRDPLKAAIQAYLRGEIGDFVFEYRMLHRDGSVIWVLSRGQLRRNAQGQPETFLGTTTDITPLKQVELALKQLNEELEQRVQQRTQALQTLAAVVENSTDLIGTTSLDGFALYLNQAGQRLMGLEDAPIAGRPIKSFLSAATLPQFEQQALPTLMAEGMWQGESIFCHAQTGAAIAVEQVMFLVKDPDTRTPLHIATICRDIRDRKRSEAEHRRAELAIKASEERFRATFEQAAVGMVQADLAGCFVKVNQTFCDLVGYSPAELKGKSYADITHPADLGEDRANVEGLLAGNATQFTMEKRYLRRDRSVVWVNLAVALVRDGAGQPQYFIGVINDLTQRKRAEFALRESQQFNQRITETTPYIIYIYDLDTHANLYANRELTHTLGYPLDHIQALGADLLTNLVHPDDFVEFEALFDRVRAAADGDVMELEYRMRHANGSWRWLYDRVAVFKRDVKGRAVQSLGIVQDVTERKQAQLDLSESRNMLRLVLDTIPQRVFWKDRESRFLGCNPAFAGDYHLTPEQVIGNTDLDLPWAAYGDRYRADDAAVMAANAPKLGYEEPTHNASGEPIWLRTSKIPLTNTQGEVIGVLGCYEDITAGKQVEESLRQLNQELEQRVQERTWELQQAVQVSEAANQAKSTFLANMSHELRTPLNAILGFAQLMARDASLSGDHSQALSIINRSGEHLLMLINDILEMAKIEAGQVSLNAVGCDLQALLSTLGDMLSLRAQDKGLDLVIDCHPTLPRYFTVDEPKLRQVLINLLGNAIKFTPAGQVMLRVAPASSTAALLPPGTLLAVTFAVVDTGIGIAAVDRDRLFEPFVQVSQGVGTGLGLSISRQFVQMLGGEITVESQPGQGATFAFTLTMQVSDGVGCCEPLPTAQITGLAPGQPSYRILVVDDDGTHRQLLREVLQAVGFDVREAASGQAALDLWQQWRPQLIWLDMRMPTLSGPETARALRSQEQGMATAATKIIALTANAFEDDRACALASGCDDFVRKPFQFDHVLAKLAEHLGVEYTYGPAFAPPGDGAALPAEAAIAQLRSLPLPLLAQLQQATVQLDGDQLTQLLTQIPPGQKALIDWLSWQIDEFAFDTLHPLLEAAQQL